MKTSLKSACKKEVVQSDDSSRGFCCHADVNKVMIVKLGYFSV